VLFLCRSRINSYGKSLGLVNSSNFINNYLTSIGVESRVSIVIDANDIDREVFNYKPSHVIIEALWVTPHKMDELLSLARYRDIQWVIRIHSKIPFLSNEGIAFPWLVGYGKLMKKFDNLTVSANSPDTGRDLQKGLGLRTVYLPNIYFPENYNLPPAVLSDEFIDIGCLGAIRPLKISLIQAMAALEYGMETGSRIRFHVNTDRLEQGGDNAYKNLVGLFSGSKYHQLIDHPWQSHRDFIHLVKTMHLGLQVSFSETFNIVAADFIHNDVPLVGSKDIEWLHESFQADTNSSADIKDKIKMALDTKDSGLYKLNAVALNKYNSEAKRVWLDYLGIAFR
jgi:hypothetical protein